MYSNHKSIVLILNLFVFSLTYCLNLDFRDIASECISIISISLAIYTLCISNLVGSSLLVKMRTAVDTKIPSKSQLAILKTYIKSGMFIAIATLISACLIKLEIPTNENSLEFSEEIAVWLETVDFFQLFSSFCFSLFITNFSFIILIFIFILSKQLDIC